MKARAIIIHILVLTTSTILSGCSTEWEEFQLKNETPSYSYNSEDIKHCMDVLKKNDFINDEKFADSFLYSEVARKWRPLFIIKQKLIQRWINKWLLTKKITEQQEELVQWMRNSIRKELDHYKKKWIDWFDSIQKLMRRWYQLADIKYVIKKSNE